MARSLRRAETEDGGSRSSFPDLDPSLRSPHSRPADIIHGVASLTPPMSRADRPFVFTDHVAFPG